MRALVLIALMSVTSSALADETPLVAQVPEAPQNHTTRTARASKWKPEWPHANEWDYTLAGLSVGVLTFEGLVLQPATPQMRWASPILFDTALRDALHTDDPNKEHTVDNLTWGLWGAQFAIPVLIDLPYAWARFGFPLARDLFWQDVVTLSLAGAVGLALRDSVGRARPPVTECIESGRSDCIYGPEAVRSFPGGHFLNGTATSVLTCTQHLYVHLYGGPWDAFTCAMTLASDVAIGFLRIVQDTHWATDELAGAAIGALIGWGVPYFMHFSGIGKSPTTAQPSGSAADANEPKPRSPSAVVVPIPMAYDRGGGFGVTGIF